MGTLYIFSQIICTGTISVKKEYQNFSLINPIHLNFTFESLSIRYRIIPKISPGLIFGQSTLFWAYFRGGLFSGGAYFWDEIPVKKRGGLIIEGYISATVTKRIRII